MSLFRRLAVIASSPCSSLLTKTLTKTATATTSRGFSSMATISRKMKTSTPTGITAASTTTTGTGTGTVGWLGSLHHATAGIITRSFASKKHKLLLTNHAKGFRGRSKNCYSIAVRRVEKGWQYAYRDRKRKRRNIKRLWIQKINAGLRQYGWNYSSFIPHLSYESGCTDRASGNSNSNSSNDDEEDDDATAATAATLSNNNITKKNNNTTKKNNDATKKDSGVRLNRKILAELAAAEPMSFRAVIEVVQESTGIYKEAARYSHENGGGWDFEGDTNGDGSDGGMDDYYYDPDTSEWLPKNQQHQKQQQF